MSLFFLAMALLVALLPRWMALKVYVLSLLWYPSSSLQVLEIDLSLSRLLGIILCCRVIMDGKYVIREFNWTDRAVLLYSCLRIVAGLVAQPDQLGSIAFRRLGWCIDTLVPYLLVRWSISCKNEFYDMIRTLVYSGGLIAITAVIEVTTGVNIIAFGKKFGRGASRWGFVRASGSFSHPIYFGVTMAVISVLAVALAKSTGGNLSYSFAAVGSLIAVVVSFSGGAYFTGIAALAFTFGYSYRGYWKAWLAVLAAMLVATEVLSNRHFYNVVDRFGVSPETAWYRSKLFEIALLKGGMTGHWLWGFGERDPGWYTMLGGSTTDLVNEYIYILASSGVLALAAFIVALASAGTAIARSLREVEAERDRIMLWGVAAGLVGYAVAFHGVSLWGTAISFFFIILGLAASSDKVFRELCLAPLSCGY
jgi:hypothetical protein